MSASLSEATDAKTIVVTGGTAGLGVETLRQLVARKDETYHVFIGCRKVPASEDAEVLRQYRSSPQTTIEYLPLDLSSYSSIESFTEQVKERVRTKTRPEIDALFFCAANVFTKCETYNVPNGREVEGSVFVNALSHAIIVKELLPLLPHNGRIAIVNSGAHIMASKRNPVTPKTIDSVMNSPSNWPGAFRSYSVSKLVEMHLAFVINDKVQSGGSNISVISTHPGFVPNTNIARAGPWIFQWLLKNIIPWLPYVTSLEKGGGILARSIFDETLPTTTYLTPSGVNPVAPECLDTELRKEWAEWFRSLGVWD